MQNAIWYVVAAVAGGVFDHFCVAPFIGWTKAKITDLEQRLAAAQQALKNPPAPKM